MQRGLSILHSQFIFVSFRYRYLHSKGILYCDLKPSNILFNGSGVLKFCDFEQSRRISELGNESNTVSSWVHAEAIFFGNSNNHSSNTSAYTRPTADNIMDAMMTATESSK